MKRRTTYCTFVGAFPGALPILMGWTAARGTLDIGG
jgi:protoheme IX farnesyltransferase